MTATRRLAAILAADVAGYSRLIGADEGGTLQALRVIRAELIDPTIVAHNGRLVKTTGDGLLVEFGSVVDALQCAIEVQAGMAERKSTVPIDQAYRISHRHQRGRHCGGGWRHFRRRGECRGSSGRLSSARRHLRFCSSARGCRGQTRSRLRGPG